MKRMKIGVVGYFGYGNYGDELFLDVYRKYFYDCDIHVLCNKPDNPVYPENMQTISQCDAIIIGGGDLFIPKYFAQTYFDNRYLDRPIYFHCIGVPQWIGEDPKIIVRMAEFVQHPNVRKINVRDIESQDWVKSRLQPNIEIDCSVDMVFAHDLPAVKREKGQKILGLIMRKLTLDETKWNNISAFLDRARGYGYKIHNIVLGTGQTRDDDLAFLQECPYQHMTLVDPNDLHGLALAIGACDIVASTKFHGCVVATSYGIPAITLTTTNKFISLCRIIERPDLLTHYIHNDLVERLPKYMAPIPSLTRLSLKMEAHQAMVSLRRAVLNEVD